MAGSGTADRPAYDSTAQPGCTAGQPNAVSPHHSTLTGYCWGAILITPRSCDYRRGTTTTALSGAYLRSGRSLRHSRVELDGS